MDLLKEKGWKMIYHANTDHRKTISNKIYFRTRNNMRAKEHHYLIVGQFIVIGDQVIKET